MKYRSTPIKSMLFFILMCLLLAGFTNMGGSSAGYKASKPTKTPTPSRTPTRTPTATRTQTPSPTITNTPPPTGTPFVCLTWSLASDFRISPNQENPNRDSCNNLGVWKFMGSTDLTPNPANYFLLPNFNPAAAGVQGLNKWYGASSDGHISFNASGSTYISGSITWPANTIDVHPGPARMVVMAWQSPLTGFVSITGGVNDNNPFMGNCNAQDGIRWYLDRNTTSLASGVIANGGAQAFADGTGGAELNTVAVSTGDMIYLAIHPDSNYYCDDTGVDLVISATTPPTDTPTPTATFTPSPTVTPTQPSNGYNYNRTAAVAYADQWAHEPRNSTFSNVLPSGSSYTGCSCDNCTNFMSQVLYAGGYPFHGNPPDDWLENWWYTSNSSSLSWRHVGSFINYFNEYPSEFDIVSQVELLDQGDVIVLDLEGTTPGSPPDGTFDHIKVVVGNGLISTDLNEYITCENGIPVTPTNIPPLDSTVLINQNCFDRKRVAWYYNVPFNAQKIFVHVID